MKVRSFILVLAVMMCSQHVCALESEYTVEVSQAKSGQPAVISTEARVLYDKLIRVFNEGRYDFDISQGYVNIFRDAELVELMDTVKAQFLTMELGSLYIDKMALEHVKAEPVVSTLSNLEVSESAVMEDLCINYTLDGSAYIKVSDRELFDFLMAFKLDMSEQQFQQMLRTGELAAGLERKIWTRAYQSSIQGDMSKKCTLNVEQIERGLKGKLKGYGWMLLELQEKYNVGLEYAVAVADIETSCGTAGYGRSICNLYNIRYFNGDYKNYMGAPDPVAASLEDFFKLISHQYLDPDGAYYNGTCVEDVSILYAEAGAWSDGVRSCVQGFYSRAEE